MSEEEIENLDERILEDIEQLLTKLNLKMEKLLMCQYWLRSFSDDVKKAQEKRAPGVV